MLPRHPRSTQAQPYAKAAELRADLDVLYRSLHRQRLGAARARAAARPAPRGRSVRLPSRERRPAPEFATCTSASLAELLATPAPAPTTRRWTKPSASRCCSPSSPIARPLGLAVRDLFATRRPASSTIAARGGATPIAATARTPSRTTSSRRPTTVSDMLEVALLLKEVGLLRPRDGPARRQHRAAVRDHRRPAQLRRA